MDDYEKMLDKAIKDMPKSAIESQRFEVPKVRGHIQGYRTIITNFHAIAQHLHRDVHHLLKFVLKELATPGDLKKSALIVGSKVPASRINEKIRQYVNTFVTCNECGKPDTKLIKEGTLTFIQCLACGAKYHVKGKV